MSRIHLLSTALGAVLLASPALVHAAAADCSPTAVEASRPANIILAQDSSSGGLSGSTPGSPGAGPAGSSTPRTTDGSALRPPQGAATTGVGGATGTNSTVGRGAPPPGTATAPQVGGGAAGGSTGPAVVQPGRTTGSGTTNR